MGKGRSGWLWVVVGGLGWPWAGLSCSYLDRNNTNDQVTKNSLVRFPTLLVFFHWCSIEEPSGGNRWRGGVLWQYLSVNFRREEVNVVVRVFGLFRGPLWVDLDERGRLVGCK